MSGKERGTCGRKGKTRIARGNWLEKGRYNYSTFNSSIFLLDKLSLGRKASPQLIM